MPRRLHFTRSHAILRLKRHLEQDSFPRIQMSLIVGLTGAAGLLFSFVMLELGVTSMALRYPLALLMAYGVFLLLLWLWLHTKAEDYVDIPDFSGSGSSESRDCTSAFDGGGGHFGGGGASGSFDMPAGSDSSPLSDAVGALGDADELAIPLLVIVFAVGLALASFYVVYVAPMLFAELLVDGALSYALYRRIKATDSPHWVESAVRRTALPFVLTAVFVSATGAAMAAYAPGAHSIGQVVQHTQTKQ
ncbi:MAG: hypothetical protein K0M39_04200 [Rhizobium sp.]|jgi:hypothetical protein|uniref:hypothetical protein n=1 Tax=Thiobacillus sp. TaxID=924 RepID=UPI0025ECA183|nr:hypothetical protein [Thiobacillus sp.]MBW8363732.1 hypothetical protein [Rhizobium sp.]